MFEDKPSKLHLMNLSVVANTRKQSGYKDSEKTVREGKKEQKTAALIFIMVNKYTVDDTFSA